MNRQELNRLDQWITRTPDDWGTEDDSAEEDAPVVDDQEKDFDDSLSESDAEIELYLLVDEQ